MDALLDTFMSRGLASWREVKVAARDPIDSGSCVTFRQALAEHRKPTDYRPHFEPRTSKPVVKLTAHQRGILSVWTQFSVACLRTRNAFAKEESHKLLWPCVFFAVSQARKARTNFEQG